MPCSIPTARRVQYALGYLALEMPQDALEELSVVEPKDQSVYEVIAVRADAHAQAKQWDRAVEYASQLVQQQPSDPHGWILLGVATRRVVSVAAAEDILVRALPHIGAKDATVHYNLACYRCLRGDLDAARLALARACEMEERFKQAALEDPDLEAFHAELRAKR